MSCDCASPFRDIISAGVTSISVNAILAPSADYLWEITDRFGNQYLLPFTTDEDGKGAIAASDLPAGFLNASMGTFSIRVKKTPDSCTYEQMVMAVNYMQLDVDILTSSLPKSKVGCEVSFPVSSGLSAKAQTFAITEEQAGATFTIPEAIGSLAVLRNGISDEQVAFDAATHTWTFTNALTAGEVVRFIYNRS